MKTITCCMIAAISLGLMISDWVFAQDAGVRSGNSVAGDTDWANRDFWETTTGKPVSEGWHFADGEITLVQPRKGGNIVSPPLSPNFELTWLWKIEKGVNSGLKYRVRRFGKQLFGNSLLGLEYQIIDSSADSTSKGSTASIYDLVAPVKDKTLNPPGQWNSSKIVAVGDRIEHYLNGTLVAASQTLGPAWDTIVAMSKFNGADGFGRPHDGDRIMLTDHGGKVSYKNFKFVAVEPSPVETAQLAAAATSDGPYLANATRNGWADQTSIVIWTRTTRNPEMLVDGKRFVKISTKEAGQMAKLKDADALLAKQLPDGATIEEMFGAVPGAAGKVRLSYYPGSQRNRMQHTAWRTTSATSDFTAQWALKGLKPGTMYTTIVEAQTLAGKASAVLCGSFRTAPQPSDRKPLKFCITTCHDFIRRDDGMNGHKIYPAMKRINPHFVVHAGDIEYYDKPDPWALTRPLMRYKWGRIFALPNNRDFYNRTTSYFIKDDHDTLANDSWPGQTYGAVTFAQGAALFNEEQFPSRDPRYQTVRWGHDVQIWILEGRDYRSPNNMPDGPAKSILGKQQKAWLFDTLAESKSHFKLICSPTPIVGPDRANKKDNHANDVFAYEGNEIRERLATIPGVIVFCGDRHWQYASVDEKTQLWEFGCGPGSEKHQLGWKVGDQRPVHRFLRVNGGFISGRLTYADDSETPKLVIAHHSVAGDEVSRFEFPADTNKESENKLDNEARADSNPAPGN